MGRHLDDARRLDAGQRGDPGIQVVVMLDHADADLGHLLAGDHRQPLDHRRAEGPGQRAAQLRVVEGGQLRGGGEFELELEPETDIGGRHGRTRTKSVHCLTAGPPRP